MKITPPVIAAMALLVPLASVSHLYFAGMGRLQMLSEKELIEAYHSMEPGALRPVYYLNYLPASATYYSRGKATMLTGADAGLPPQGFFLAVHKTEGDAPRWRCTLQYQPGHGIFDLYLCHE